MTMRRIPVVFILVVLLLFIVSCGLFGGDDPTATPVVRSEAVEATATTAPAATAVSAATEAVAEPTATTAAESEAATAPTAAVEAAATEAVAEPTATTAAESEAATAPTAAVEAVATEEAGEESDLPSMAALEGVDTYEAQMTLQMTRTDDETVITFIDMAVKVDRVNSAHQVTMQTSEEGQDSMVIEMVTIGDDSWMSFGDGWMHTKSDEESLSSGVDDFLMVGSDALSSIEEPVLVAKGEEVNGMMTDHYTFTQSELTGMEFMFISEVEGDVWVSQDGDYVVKMAMNGTGTMPGDDDTEVPTAMNMTWELLSVNQPLTIEPPAGFSDADMLPIMEGALSSNNYFSTADMAMYEIEATAEEVLQWYKDTLEADGWVIESEDEMEGLSSANFSKDGESIGVMVMPSETEGAVSVMVTKG